MLKSRIPQIAAALPAGMDAATKKGAELIAQRAKERTPVLSGALKDAIHVEAAEGVGHYVVAGGGEDDVFYGHMVEFGTSHSGPHPFLVPAEEESKDEIIELGVVVLRAL